MVRQQRLEVFLTISAEEERVNLRSKLLKCEVGRCEQCAAIVVRGVINHREQACFGESQFKRAEVARKELDYLSGFWWWD